MPLSKYELDKKSFRDSVNLNLTSSVSIDSTATISENNLKRQHIESTDENIQSESTITITASTENFNEQSYKKKMKTHSNEDQVIIPVITQSSTDSPSVQSPPSILKEAIVDNETTLISSSTNSRIRELKSKTPTWKTRTPPAKGNVHGNYCISFSIIWSQVIIDKIHIRFDSDNDEEQCTVASTKESATALCLVNDSNSSFHVADVPPTTVVKQSKERKTKKKTVDLLFEIKQHKSPNERPTKKIQQQFAKKRAQHRKRALDYLSMANFVDQAFGLDKNELKKQISSNGYHTSSSTPQVN